MGARRQTATRDGSAPVYATGEPIRRRSVRRRCAQKERTAGPTRGPQPRQRGGSLGPPEDRAAPAASRHALLPVRKARCSSAAEGETEETNVGVRDLAPQVQPSIRSGG